MAMANAVTARARAMWSDCARMCNNVSCVVALLVVAASLPHGINAQVAPAGAPPSGTPPAGTPPAGAPPAGTPPAGAPPAGTPSVRAPLPASTVRGQVRSRQTQLPVAGVQVSIVGTSDVAVTDESGRYVLRTAATGRIGVQTRAIGYGSVVKELDVSGGDDSVQDTVLDFVLERSALQLDQMIVTGTAGAVEKRSVGNAVSSVPVADLVQSSPTFDVSGLLKGRAAGVTTLSQSGSIGAGSALRIRGTGSISLTNAPLIYVDGVRLDNTSGSILNAATQGSASRLDDINPGDIASIEIIKGPAAATLYGTEASNGVVQIITRNGAAGTSSTTAQIRVGANTLANQERVFPLNWYIDSTGTPVSQNLVATENDAGRPIFRSGLLRQLDLSTDGGSQNARYFISGGYLSNDGVYANNSLRRLTARANVGATVTPALSVQGNIAFVQSTNPQMSEAPTATFGVVPMIVFGSPASRNQRLRGFLRAPPEASATIDQSESVNRTTIALNASYAPRAWFSSRLNTGLDWVSQQNSTLYPHDPTGFFGSQSTGSKSINQYTRKNTTVDWAATASIAAPAETKFATSVGLQYYDRTSTLVSANAQGFPSPGLETISAGAVTTAGESFIQNKTLGAFVQEEISSRNRRFLTLALRGDANSAFGDQYKPAYYPKVSGAWVVSDEAVPIPAFLTQLRLRGAFGFSGLQPDVLAAVRTYAPIAGTGGQPAILPQSPGNENIRPERSRELELGVDVDLFKGRGGIVFTYFDKLTRDAIVAVPGAPSSGFPGNEFRNLGAVANHGFEMELNAVPVARRSAQWSVGTTVTRVTNMVNSLGGSPNINSGLGFGTIQIREGYPMGSFFARKVISAERVRADSVASILCDNGSGGSSPCAVAPQVFIASPGPGWEVALRSTLSIGNSLTLNALADGQFDTHLFSSMLFARDAVFRNSYLATHRAEMSTFELASIAVGSNAPFVANNSFMRLRELSAQYVIPSALSRRILGSRTTTLGFSVRNPGFLYRHKEARQFDPEGAIGQVSWVHFEQALMPQLRSMVFSMRVTY
ncbi:MAG: SusC/RagA family TonB-linked outer membrane protein [Gemmatimonas sp.]